MKEEGVYSLEWGDQSYPPALVGLPMPPVLYAKGNPSLISLPAVAVIGTRHPTDLGRKIARSIAATFASAGYCIVSGLASGIDTEAHRGALSVGGKTIAILGSPVTHIYPHENTPLAQSIVDSGGLLLSAYRLPEYNPSRFVERDTLQALFSLAVIPVQAGPQSGTIHAMTAARRLHRAIFVPVPVAQDEQAHPRQYKMIRQFLTWKDVTPFSGKQDYPRLLDILARAQQRPPPLFEPRSYECAVKAH